MPPFREKIFFLHLMERQTTHSGGKWRDSHATLFVNPKSMVEYQNLLMPWNNQMSKPYYHPIALRKTKIVNNFGLSECNRVKCLPPAAA